MIQTKGFLYGHYDSRGGTMFVVAPNRDAADKAYVKAAGWPEDLLEEAKTMIEEDFYGEALVFSQAALPEGDLEEQHEGAVICSGDRIYWPPDPAIDGEEFMDNEEKGTLFLEFVEKDAQPFAFKTGWHQPRWNDDAFGFHVVKA
jgi:hypothetical protein